MKHFITLIAILISSLTYGQGVNVSFGGSRPIDTAYAGRSLKVDSAVRLIKYSTADTTMFFGMTSNGILTMRRIAAVSGTGNINAIPVFTAANTIGSTANTDTPGKNCFNVFDTLRLKRVPYTTNAQDSVLVAGATLGTVRKAGYPTSPDNSIGITWPANTYTLAPVGVNKGGTGILSYTAGDIPVASGTSSMTALHSGGSGQVMAINPGTLLPYWATFTFAGSVTPLNGSMIASPTTGAVQIAVNPAYTNSFTVTEGYAANIASLYAARSFTDKNYVDSSTNGTVKSITITTSGILYPSSVSASISGTAANIPMTLQSQAAHKIFAGALSSVTTPSFRALDTTDMEVVNTNIGSFGGPLNIPIPTFNQYGLCTGVTTATITAAATPTITVVNANGFSGTFTTGLNPAATFSTTVTTGSLLKSSSGAIVPAVANTDYTTPSYVTTALAAYVPTTTATAGGSGAYGSASTSPVFNLTSYGQTWGVINTPISIASAQINNASTSLWQVGGNNLLANSYIGINGAYAFYTKVNGLTRDSVAASGVTYINGDSASGPTTAVTASLSIGNSVNTGFQQTQRLWMGVGKGGSTICPLNMPYISWGTTDNANNQFINIQGFFQWSFMYWRNTTSTPITMRGAFPTGTGNSFTLNQGGGSGGNGYTTGIFTIIGVNQDDGTHNYWFAPASGNSVQYAVSDQTGYSQAAGCTGITASFTNAQINMITASAYRGLYLTNNVGYQVYCNGTAPSLFNGTVSALHYICNSSAPTIAAGTGAGTTPTVSMGTGATDGSGYVNITTGTTPTASANVATITFNTAYGIAPKVMLTPANAATATLSGTSTVYVDQATGVTTTTFIIKANTAALVASTAYQWWYSVQQ